MIRSLVAVFGRYTDLSSADMGVLIIHRSTDFYIVTKSKVGVRIIFHGVLYSKFYGNNWREITLLSTPGKVFSRVLLNRLQDAVDCTYGMSRRASEEGIHALSKYLPCGTSLN